MYIPVFRIWHKPVFLNLHWNHQGCLLTMHILGAPQDLLIWISEDGIHRSTDTASHPCDFCAHSSSITTGITSGILGINSPCIKIFGEGRLRKWSLNCKNRHLMDQPLILFKVPKQGVVGIEEIPCQELVTPGSEFLSRKPSKEKQPAGKFSILTFMFCVVSAGSSSTSKKVMWQQETQKGDSYTPEMVLLDLGALNLPSLCFALSTTRLLSTMEPERRQWPLNLGGKLHYSSDPRPKCKNNLENIILLVSKSTLWEQSKSGRWILLSGKILILDSLDIHTYTHIPSHCKPALEKAPPWMLTDTIQSCIPPAHALQEWF